jgi:hypothetical protein
MTIRRKNARPLPGAIRDAAGTARLVERQTHSAPDTQVIFGIVVEEMPASAREVKRSTAPAQQPHLHRYVVASRIGSRTDWPKSQWVESIIEGKGNIKDVESR